MKKVYSSKKKKMKKVSITVYYYLDLLNKADVYYSTLEVCLGGKLSIWVGVDGCLLRDLPVL